MSMSNVIRCSKSARPMKQKVRIDKAVQMVGDYGPCLELDFQGSATKYRDWYPLGEVECASEDSKLGRLCVAVLGELRDFSPQELVGKHCYVEIGFKPTKKNPNPRYPSILSVHREA